MNIVSINSGSSSIKFGIFEVFTESRPEESSVNELFSQSLIDASPTEVFSKVKKHLTDSNLDEPTIIGHRLVHGGPKLRHHCVIDESVINQLESSIPFAPLHLPDSIALIREAQVQFPFAVQVACFDTSFHSTLPDVARVFPIAHAWQSEGIHRYGFHGISCESMLRQIRERQVANFPKRLIVAHIGNGVSVTAIKDGESVDTSMGLTPSGGVIMGTRSGDVDPGLLIYLMREKKLDLAGLEQSINHESGLLGVSGLSNDMRKLHEAAALTVHPSNASARLAIQMFCYSLRKQIAAMMAVLEGVDMLVFTGGIGENDEEVRLAVYEGLSWVNSSHSHFEILVLPSQEEEQIARIVFRLPNV